ncbi:aldo/keto reductase [candidate division KSB1 bacterium]
MLYREFGSTGKKISQLGFGAMRLPEVNLNGAWYVDEDKALDAIHHAFRNGVNYIDTAYMYCHGNSEQAVGKALKGWRDKVYVSTKLPLYDMKNESDFERLFEEQMKRLDVEHIDFYHLHSISKDKYENVILRFGLIEKMQRAKESGSIGHVSFSFHDKAEVLREIIDAGFSETMLVQYNMIDRVNEEMIRYARNKGMGTVVMGPVSGGRLAIPSKHVAHIDKDRTADLPHLAMRFVASNKHVDCVLSGMSTRDMVDRNIAAVTQNTPLSDAEKELIDRYSVELNRLTDIYCNACDYCMPCPNDVNISLNFECLIYHKVYDMKKTAQARYNLIGNSPWFPGKNASACEECGECEPLCPQEIPIMEQLKATAKLFQ